MSGRSKELSEKKNGIKRSGIGDGTEDHAA